MSNLDSARDAKEDFLPYAQHIQDFNGLGLRQVNKNKWEIVLNLKNPPKIQVPKDWNWKGVPICIHITGTVRTYA